MTILSILLLAFLQSGSSAAAPGILTASSTDCSIGAACTALTLPVINGTQSAGAATVVLGGTYSGTNQFEMTAGPANCNPLQPTGAGSCTWVAASGSPRPSGTGVTSATGTGTWVFDVAGMLGLRVRNSTFGSGAVIVSITPGSAQAASGGTAAVQGNPGSQTPAGNANNPTSLNLPQVVGPVTVAGTGASNSVQINTAGLTSVTAVVVVGTTLTVVPEITFDPAALTNSAATSWLGGNGLFQYWTTSNFGMTTGGTSITASGPYFFTLPYNAVGFRLRPTVSTGTNTILFVGAFNQGCTMTGQQGILPCLGDGNGPGLFVQMLGNTAAADGASNSTLALSKPQAFNNLFNGTTWDRQRNNTPSATVGITCAGCTTGQNGTDQINYNGGKVACTLDMTNVGTGSVTFTIQGKDEVSGKYYTLLAGVAVVTNVTNVYSVGTGLPVSSNVSANAILPRTWRAITVANNANATTYTVGCTNTL